MAVNLTIDKKDIKYVKEILSGGSSPMELDEIAYRIAMFKTQDNRAHKVKIYNPDCEFKVGDLIYKEYPGKIPIGSKKYIELDEGVVLKVIDIRNRYGIEEIKLAYEGVSEFKKYLAYLDRQKIELLLPHKQQKPPEKAELLTSDIDPRMQQDPLEKKDFTLLKRKLSAALNKEPDVAIINDKVLLHNQLKEFEPQVFEKIREFLLETKESETTEFLIENFARIKPENPEFKSFCFSLNYKMTVDYKLDFQQTRFEGWGKWNLISVIYYMIKNSPISEENPLLHEVRLTNKKNLTQRRRKFEETAFSDEAGNRFFLTQREITAGAVKIKPGIFNFGDAIEIELYDSKTKKRYLVNYYSDANIILGFKGIFEKYRMLQAGIISFEQDSEGKWLFTVRTTKKGAIADVVEYDPEKKAFKALEEKVASPVFVYKAMFLESDVINAVYTNIDHYRVMDSMNALVHKICLDFGVKERNYEIHILRLYHILDLIYPVDIKIVEDVVLSNNEFVSSDKLPGVFYLDSTAVTAIVEEETQRQAVVREEIKKKKEDKKRKRQEEELRLKEEIKLKREERRRKREEEMWQKEKLYNPQPEESEYYEDGREYEGEYDETGAPPVYDDAEYSGEAGGEEVYDEYEPYDDRDADLPPADGENVEPETGELPHSPALPEPTPKPGAPITPTTDEEIISHKKARKKMEEERGSRPGKRPAVLPEDEGLSEEEIRSQIALEELKEKMRMRELANAKKALKAKEIAYKDTAASLGGTLASKLDEIVKKEDPKKKKDNK